MALAPLIKFKNTCDGAGGQLKQAKTELKPMFVLKSRAGVKGLQATL